MAYVVTLFILSLLIMFNKGSDIAPVTPENVVAKFLYLDDAHNKKRNVDSELDDLVKSICQLNNQNPLRLVEVAKESHCLLFNHVLYMVRWGRFFRDRYSGVTPLLRAFKQAEKSNALKWSCRNFVYDAYKILENLKLKLEDQSKNEESFKIISNLMTIAREFVSKIKDLLEREKKFNGCKVVSFIVENLAIDYQNGTIDYGAFMTVFYEIKSLYLTKSKDENLRKRLKKLKGLFQIYAALIQKSQCFLVFDFYPAEELFYMILDNEKGPFRRRSSYKKIFSGPKEKYLALESLYKWFGRKIFEKLGGILIKGADQMNTAIFIKKRFFTKLCGFLKVTENFDYLWNSGHSEYLSDNYFWIFMGLSKIESYLTSFKISK
jgi:hypothetical protein